MLPTANPSMTRSVSRRRASGIGLCVMRCFVRDEVSQMAGDGRREVGPACSLAEVVQVAVGSRMHGAFPLLPTLLAAFSLATGLLLILLMVKVLPDPAAAVAASAVATVAPVEAEASRLPPPFAAAKPRLRSRFR